MLEATIVDCLIGVFAFDEGNRVIDLVFFPRERMIEAVRRVQRGEVVKEVAELVNGLIEKDYRKLIFENDDLAISVKKEFDVEVSVESPSRGGKFLRDNMGRLVLDEGYVKNLREFYAIVHEATTRLARDAVKEASARRDRLISQTILIIDDLDRVFNLFTNRLREWYGYHFPELSGLVDDNEVYVKLVSSIGLRHNFKVEELIKMGLTKARSKSIQAVAWSSMGADIEEDDIYEVQGFAKPLLGLYHSRKSLAIYLDKLMQDISPNINELVGPTLGARLIAKTGGLENLARKSSGTIQVLGAERALFRSLRTGAKPPKHGLIFQHVEVHKLPRWQRGKIARALANKLAIAARLDAYGGEYRGEELKTSFEERVKEIRTKYAEPPSGKKRRR